MVTARLALVTGMAFVGACGGPRTTEDDSGGSAGWGSAGTFVPTAGIGASGTFAGGGGMGGFAGTQAGAGGAAGGEAPKSCGLTVSRIRTTEVDLGTTVVSNEDEAALSPIVISPLSVEGSRVAFMGNDAKVHVVTLDGNDHVAPESVALAFPAHDFSDFRADEGGGVLLLTRDAEGGGTLNCGEPANLCGTPPAPAIPCHDMYLMKFFGPMEKWATKLTTSSSTLPPYSTGKTGDKVFMIWWYAHHGRIAFDGSRYASYFGTAISVSEGGCINIHQGDRLQLVDQNGKLQTTGGFELGCSHSGYERILWDDVAGKLVTVCKTDNQNRIAIAPDYVTIAPVDLAYSNLGNLVRGSGTSAGYWLTVSNLRAGQPANMDGLAETHLMHFVDGAADMDQLLPSAATDNARAPHLAAYGADHMLAGWETSTALGDLKPDDTMRTFHLQSRNRSTGEADGEPVTAVVRGNRYQDLVTFPDGSVAFVGPGSTAAKIVVIRVLPCP